MPASCPKASHVNQRGRFLGSAVPSRVPGVAVLPSGQAAFWCCDPRHSILIFVTVRFFIFHFNGIAIVDNLRSGRQFMLGIFARRFGDVRLVKNQFPAD